MAFRAWHDADRPRDSENAFFKNNKIAKKTFRKRLKRVSKEYEDSKITEAVKSSELDKTIFWKMLKCERDGPKIRTPAIKNKEGKVIHDVKEILKVWQTHFSAVGTPTHSPNYEAAHYADVTAKVSGWLLSSDEDDFSKDPISYKEVEKAVSTLNSGKASGDDGVTKEHLKDAGPQMIKTLTIIYNHIWELEYIPLHFRKGIQIPLYKRKNAPILECNNYQGMTHLSTFNEVFEILVWKRMEKWWYDARVLSQLQGACRKAVSCVHMAYFLQETISTLVQSNKKAFVTYLDVSKAFDGVWIERLFYRLRELGISGRTWRLLYKFYLGLRCRA